MNRKFANLDGIRGIAILSVLGLHGSYGYLKGGFLGVDLFFVLSGFLITWLLNKELLDTGSISLRNFYIRRALRLFPAMAVAILLTACSWPWTATEDNNLSLAILSVCFYFANLVPSHNLGPFSAWWSLALEEQFYIAWPLLFLLASKGAATKRVTLYIFLSTTIVSALLFRIIASQLYPGTFDLYRFTLARIDSIAIGSLAALLFADGHHPSRKVGKVIAVPLLVLYSVGLFTIPSNSYYMINGGFTVVSLGFALLVVCLSGMDATRVFANPLLVWIGRRSYGIYIYHLPIFSLLEYLRTQDSAANAMLVTFLRFAVTFLVAGISFRFIESPALCFKEKFSHDRISKAPEPPRRMDQPSGPPESPFRAS